MAAGDNTLLTVSPGHTVIVERFHVVNSTSATKLTAKIGLNASADANLVSPAMTIPGKQMVDQDTFIVMNADVDSVVVDSLVLNASATGLTVTVYGTDQYPHY